MQIFFLLFSYVSLNHMTASVNTPLNYSITCQTHRSLIPSMPCKIFKPLRVLFFCFAVISQYMY